MTKDSEKSVSQDGSLNDGGLSETVLEGKYEFVRPISEGGMGRVYLVRHRHLDEERVIKVIRRQHAGDADLQKRFLQEARAAARLRHQNLAETYDFSIDDDGNAYIVMEYIAGKTLQDILRAGGPPPLELAIEIGVQTLAGLGYLHRRGYIHRDVAPDNTMLCRDYDGQAQIKLIDLGIAKRMGESAGGTAAGMFLGKARYASPEQFGRGTVDHRSDLYSFAVVFYELLTGRSPLPGDTLSELISSHLFETPLAFAESDPHGRVPNGVREVVLKALGKDPATRFESAAELGARLDALRPGPLGKATLDLALTDRPAGAPIVFEPTLPMTTPLPAPLDGGADPLLIPPTLLRARQTIEEGRYEEAREQLQAFLRVHPNSGTAVALLESLEERLQEIEDARRGAITAWAERIQQLLADGALESARSELERAVAEYGEAELFRRLAKKLEQALAEHEDALRQAEIERQREAERQQTITDREAKIRGYLAQGDFEAADRSLAFAMSDLGASPAWDALLEELEQHARQREELRQRASEQLEIARQALAEGQLTEARRLTEASRQLADSEDAHRLQLEIEGAQAEERARLEREQQRMAAVANIEWKLAAGAFDRASELLEDTQTLFEPGDTRLEELSRQVAEQQQEARDAELIHLKQRVERSLQAEDFEGAIQILHQVLEVDPEHEAAQHLLLEVEADFQRWVHVQARRAACQRAVSAVEALLDENQLDDARMTLEALKAEHEPPSDEIQRLEARLAEREKARRAEHEREIVELLQTAQMHLEQQEFEPALDRVRTALDLDPDSLGLRELLQEIENACRDALDRRAADEAQTPQAWAEVAVKITTLLDHGQSSIARQLLEAAERDYGERPFRALRQRLEES